MDMRMDLFIGANHVKNQHHARRLFGYSTNKDSNQLYFRHDYEKQ